MCQIASEIEATAPAGPQVFTYFSTLIYTDTKPEFLDAGGAITKSSAYLAVSCLANANLSFIAACSNAHGGL